MELFFDLVYTPHKLIPSSIPALCSQLFLSHYFDCGRVEKLCERLAVHELQHQAAPHPHLLVLLDVSATYHLEELMKVAVKQFKAKFAGSGSAEAKKKEFDVVTAKLSRETFRILCRELC